MTRPVRVLTIAPRGGERLKGVDPLLSQPLVEANRVMSGQAALALASSVRYELIIVEHPMPDMGLASYLETLHDAENASCHTKVFVLPLSEFSRPSELTETLGPIQVFGTGSEAELRTAVGRLISQANRESLRLLATVEARGGTDTTAMICQTRDISVTGAFLATGLNLSIGQSLTVSLAMSHGPPIMASAEVVRASQPRVEAATGFGIRFTGFEQDGRERLQSFLDQREP